MPRLYAFAEHDFIIEKPPFFAVGERREARERMHARLLNHGEKVVLVWVIPSKQCKVGAVRIADRILCKHGIRDESSLVHAGRRIGCIP